MELKIKEEYLEYSIGGGKMKSTKLKNMIPEQYEYFYNNGFEKFFNIIEDIIIEEDFFNEEDTTEE